MSSATWAGIQRRLSLLQLVERRAIDVFAMLVAIEFSKRVPFFVQVGANDGINDDQISRFVKERGWRGILVEPQPDVFERLQENYKSSQQLAFANVAIGRGNGRLKLYRLRVPAMNGTVPDAFTTFDRSKLVRAKRRFDWSYPIDEIEVPTTTVQQLLHQHGAQSCDVLIIDTEGMDFEVIQTVDFSLCAPTIIQFEHIHMSVEELKRCFEYLSNHDYRFACVRRDVIAHRPRHTCT